MDEGVKALREGRVQLFLYKNVSVDKAVLLKKILPKAAGKVVKYSDLVALLVQFLHYMASDISGSADYQNVHNCLRMTAQMGLSP